MYYTISRKRKKKENSLEERLFYNRETLSLRYPEGHPATAKPRTTCENPIEIVYPVQIDLFAV
jgi:hypothetical protein